MEIPVKEGTSKVCSVEARSLGVVGNDELGIIDSVAGCQKRGDCAIERV